MQEHHLTVPCTARYFTLGAPSPATRQVWFVCHGYGQLADRFLNDFVVLEDPQRYLVAPEGLSRYYVNHSKREVGASWMTCEDRLADIANHVRYLDVLYDQIFRTLRRTQVAVTVLGFSQGAATAARWISHGRAIADRLILWGELLPPDLDLDSAWGKLEDARLTFVAGRDDAYVDQSRLAEWEALLLDRDIPFETVRYDGGHWIDPVVLRSLAAV
ncbi:MAG: phospholipase [Gemmatimonadales bacterium]|nr:phospholipase [Gemmatimonadales bacterium]